MRNLIYVSALVLAAGALGCGKKPGPEAATPEMEAEQRQEEKLARDAESARQKSPKQPTSPRGRDRRAE